MVTKSESKEKSKEQEDSQEKEPVPIEIQGDIKHYLTIKEILRLRDIYSAVYKANRGWSKGGGSTSSERREIDELKRGVDAKKLERLFELEINQYFPKEPKISKELAARLNRMAPRHQYDRPPYDAEADRQYRELCFKSDQEHHKFFNKQSPETQRDWIERELLMGADYRMYDIGETSVKALYHSVSEEERKIIFTLLARDRVGAEYPPSADHRDLEREYEAYVEAMKRLKKAGSVEKLEKMPIAKFVASSMFEDGENSNTPDDKLSENTKRHSNKERMLELAIKIEGLKEEASEGESKEEGDRGEKISKAEKEVEQAFEKGGEGE